jgi:cell division protein FtsZ
VDWLVQYWPAVLLVVVLVGAVVFRVVAGMQRRRRPRHTGERTIRVVGVGGAGGNAVDDMIDARVGGVDYVAINTDGQFLEESMARRRIRIGDRVTRGLGAGGDPEIGRIAAEEDAEPIRLALEGADLVFVAAGLGGGTGSGAGPVIGAAAKELGALTVGVVTLPFAFEGPARREIADRAVTAMLASVDTLLVIENERATELVTDQTSLREAFRTVNQVLVQAVRGVADIMTVPGLVNVDFADVQSIMRDGGMGLAGIGRASGEGRAIAAAQAAIASPLLAHHIDGAQRILLNVAAASRMTLREVIEVADTVGAAAGGSAKVVFGATSDDRMKDALCVTVIATGFADRPTIGLADGNGGGRRRAAPGQAASGQAETVSGTAAS